MDRNYVNTTIVTAFFDIGVFKKGTEGNRDASHYYKWCKPWKYILNPVIIYTDSPDFAKIMTETRKDLAHFTVLKMVKRGDYWPCQYETRITEVFSQKDYPVHYPNTVSASYSCVQHAKHPIVAESAREGLFDTPFYAWLDVGYFRDINKETNFFTVNAPKNFETAKIAMNHVEPSFSLELPFKKIIHENLVKIGGGMFIGTAEKIQEYNGQVRKAFEHLLELNLMDTDQQTLYSMYSNDGRREIKPSIEVQLYHNKSNPWFHLGFASRDVRSWSETTFILNPHRNYVINT